MSQLSFDVEPEHDPTFSVGELVDAVNGTLRRRFGDGVWVRGEIQGWQERGPHAYFKLVEQRGNDKAVLNVSLFAPARNRLRPILERHRLQLGDGVSVRVFGQLELYAPSGQLGLKMGDLDPRFTLGTLAVQRDEVLRRLIASGEHEANRRLALAPAPLRVGVVTSLQSAAWADFLHELERSGFAFVARVADVRVQGPTAVAMITRAITALGRAPDLHAVVIIRGGGARTELATFDDEAIARAIAHCPLPVLTGLGHEIDRSIADEVAHTSSKTPTACATALTERVASFLADVGTSWERIGSLAERRLAVATQRLDERRHLIARASTAAVGRADDRLAHRRERLHRDGLRALARADDRLERAVGSVGRLPAELDGELRHLRGIEAQVRLADPALTLARGWSITRTSAGITVRDAADLRPGDTIVTQFAAGTATSTVTGARTGTGGDTGGDAGPVPPDTRGSTTS
jgi:exodeoxyribonuclease VII large subunit